MPCIVKNTFLALLLAAPLMFGSVYSWAIGALEVVIIIISGVWLWYSHKQRESFPWRHYWGGVFLIVFLAVAFVQLLPWPTFALKLLAPENLAAWTRLRNLDFLSGDYFPPSLNPFATAYEGLKFLSYCLAFWLTINLVRHGNKRRDSNFVYSFALVVCVAGALISAVAIVQAGVGAKLIYGFWKPYHSYQFLGPYVNRNHFAGYLEMALPMGIGFFASMILLRRRRWGKNDGSQSDKQLALTFLVGLCVLLMVTGLLFSMSRGGLLSGSIVVAAQVPILLSLLSRGKSLRRVLAWGLFFVIIVAMVASLIPWEKLIERFSTLPTESVSTDIRFRVSMDTLKMSRDFPILGSGLGTYELVFPRYKTSSRQGLFQHAHNDYVEFLAETGWVGFLALMTFLAWVVARGFKIIATALRLGIQCPGSIISRACITSGSLGGILAIMLHSVVDFNLHIPANALLFFVFCGITASVGEAKI